MPLWKHLDIAVSSATTTDIDSHLDIDRHHFVYFTLEFVRYLEVCGEFSNLFLECSKLCCKCPWSAELSSMSLLWRKRLLPEGAMHLLKLRGDYGNRRWFLPLQQLLSAGCSAEVRAEVMLPICFLATHLPPTSTELLWADALTTLQCKGCRYDKVLGGKGVLRTHFTFCTN